MSQGMLEIEIRKHFLTNSGTYAFRRGSIHGFLDTLMLEYLKSNIDENATVLEVGGGSGFMLDLVGSAVETSELVNCELVTEAYMEQSNPGISLVKGNVISLPFRERSFDLVLAMNLLHHLVGGTVTLTRKNQVSAIGELTRLLKPGGTLLIFEQCYRLAAFNWLLFWITRILSSNGIEIGIVGIEKNVIVSFLTPSKISRMLDNEPSIARVFLIDVHDRPSPLKRVVKLLPAFLFSPPTNVIAMCRNVKT